MKNYIYLLLLFCIVACTPKATDTETLPGAYDIFSDSKRPKNIILMIGDGMGLSQITAGMYKNGNQLNLEQFPVIGLHKAHAFNDLITDSAAGATAFACGVKTYNGAIGVGSDTVARITILEELEQISFATGMISTSSITHATPASFISHQPSRTMMEPIAADFLKTDIDLFIGGGKKYFDGRGSDDRNLYQELEAKNYFVSDYLDKDLQDISPIAQKGFAYLTAYDQPLPAMQGRDYLRPASQLALQFLQSRSEKGFFLMIEGAQIDWGGHANDSDYIIKEMIEFDHAIGDVLRFARANSETLIIVTADHETGGYAILKGSTMDTIKGAFTSDYHTATMIPVFAYGPQSQLFNGIYENTEIYNKMRKALGLQ